MIKELFDRELDQSEEEALLQKLADKIVRRKLQAPSILFLEMHKPLAFLASQALVVFAPFVAPIVGINHVRDYCQLLSKRENVERLIQILEDSTTLEEASEVTAHG